MEKAAEHNRHDVDEIKLTSCPISFNLNGIQMQLAGYGTLLIR